MPGVPCHSCPAAAAPARTGTGGRRCTPASCFKHSRYPQSKVQRVQRVIWHVGAAAADAVVCDSCGDITSPPPNPSKTLRVAVVGDVHGQWNDNDLMALRMLNPDITLFVGDFGEEDLDLVKKIAALPINKAVIMGNHDAWYTMTDLGLKRRRRFIKETKNNKLYGWNKVRAQLAELGEFHVGYSALTVPGKDVSVVGARPFSKGGSNFDQVRSFCSKYFHVDSLEASARKILAAATGQPSHHSMIIMGHNGPFGLGSERFDICGLDFQKKGGDFGDPDLQSALDLMLNNLIHVPLVVFGHMHERLKTFAVTQPGIRGGGTRRRVYVHPNSGTVMVNAAVVPRTRDSDKLNNGAHVQQHHFVMLELVDGDVVEAKDVWVEVDPREFQNLEPAQSGAAPAVQSDTSDCTSTAGQPTLEVGSSTNPTSSLGSGNESSVPASFAESSPTSFTPHQSDQAASSRESESSPGRSASTGSLDMVPDTSVPCTYSDMTGQPDADSASSLSPPQDDSAPSSSAYKAIPGCRIASEQLFLQTIQGVNGGVVKMVWDGYRKTWKAVFTRPWSEIKAQKQQELKQRAAGAAHYAATHTGHAPAAALDADGSQAIISRGSWQEAHRAASTTASSTVNSHSIEINHDYNGNGDGSGVPAGDGSHCHESHISNEVDELLSKPVVSLPKNHDTSSTGSTAAHNSNGTGAQNGVSGSNGTHHTSSTGSTAVHNSNGTGIQNGVHGSGGRPRTRSASGSDSGNDSSLGNSRSGGRRRSNGGRSSKSAEGDSSSRSKAVGFGKDASKGSKDGGNGVRGETGAQQRKKGYKDLNKGAVDGDAAGGAAAAPPKKVRVRMGVSLVASADK